MAKLVKPLAPANLARLVGNHVKERCSYSCIRRTKMLNKFLRVKELAHFYEYSG